jgi:hypothetical protein
MFLLIIHLLNENPSIKESKLQSLPCIQSMCAKLYGDMDISIKDPIGTLDFTMQVKLLQAGLHQSTSQIHEMKLQLQLLRTQMQAASTPVCVLICHLFSPPIPKSP